MSANVPLERQLGSVMAEEAIDPGRDVLLDDILATTVRLRPEARWLALLKEPPMRTETRTAVGTPIRGLVLAALIAALVLGGIAAVVIGANLLRPPQPIVDVWPGFRGDAGRGGLGVHGPIGQPTLAWEVQADGPVVNNISIAAGLALVPSDDGVLRAIRISDGTPVWTLRATPGIGGPYVIDDRVYASDGAGVVHALNLADGREVWASTSTINSPVYFTQVGSRLITGTEDGDLIALDLASGAEAWRRTISDARPSVHSPSAGDGYVIAVADDGSFGSYDAETGDPRWQVDIGSGTNVGTPVVANGVAFLGSSADSTGWNLTAFDAATGEELWRMDESFFSPSIADGVGYLGSASGAVVAVDLTTRAELWRIQFDGIVRPPAIAGDVLYLPADGERQVVAVDRRTGAELWRYDLGASNDCCIAVADGHVFVGTTAGTAVAIGGDGAAIAPPSQRPSVTVPSATPTEGASTTPPSVSPSAAPLAVEVKELDGATFGWQFPGGLDIGPDGNLYVVSQGTPEVVVVSPAGEVLRRWGEKGTGRGQFDFERDAGDPLSSAGSVAVAADGTVYVSEGGNRRIQAFTPDGSYLDQWGSLGQGDGEFLAPLDLDFGPDGTLYVVDDRRDDIQRFTKDGRFLQRIGRHGTGPGELNGTGGLLVGPDGTVYNADFSNNRVQAWTADGAFLWTLGAGSTPAASLKTPIDMVLDGTGTTFVADDSHVQAFDQQRNLVGVWVPPRPYLGQMAIAGKTIYVTGPFDHAIWQLTLD